MAVESMLVEITLVETTLVLVGDSLYFMYEGVDDAQWTAFLRLLVEIALVEFTLVGNPSIL